MINRGIPRIPGLEEGWKEDIRQHLGVHPTLRRYDRHRVRIHQHWAAYHLARPASGTRGPSQALRILPEEVGSNCRYLGWGRPWATGVEEGSLAWAPRELSEDRPEESWGLVRRTEGSCRRGKAGHTQGSEAAGESIRRIDRLEDGLCPTVRIHVSFSRVILRNLSTGCLRCISMGDR